MHKTVSVARAASPDPAGELRVHRNFKAKDEKKTEGKIE